MTLHAIDKKKVIAALMQARRNYPGTDTQFAPIYDLNPSIFSQIKNGKEPDRLIPDDKLVNIAATLSVSLVDAPEWKIAETEAFKAYTELFRICQQEGASRMICDKAGRGKTTAAKQYMLKNKNAFYIDCSQNKSYKLIIMALCKVMGLSTLGTIHDRIMRVQRFLIAIDNPIVMLDEFGDLEYKAFLEFKAFWNATESRCGWVVIGAQGLKKKLERGAENDRVGFEEFIRRFGDDFMMAVNPMNDAEDREFFMQEATKVVAVNMPKLKVSELVPKGQSKKEVLSLTRIKERIIKMKREAA